MAEHKSETLAVRVTPATRQAFIDKAAEKATAFEGKPADVLRELVIAFIEDRITVEPRPHV